MIRYKEDGTINREGATTNATSTYVLVNEWCDALDAANAQITALRTELNEAREIAMLRTCDLNSAGKTILDFHEIWLRQANDARRTAEAERDAARAALNAARAALSLARAGHNVTITGTLPKGEASADRCSICDGPYLSCECCTTARAGRGVMIPYYADGRVDLDTMSRKYPDPYHRARVAMDALDSANAQITALQAERDAAVKLNEAVTGLLHYANNDSARDSDTMEWQRQEMARQEAEINAVTEERDAARAALATCQEWKQTGMAQQLHEEIVQNQSLRAELEKIRVAQTNA